MILHPTPRSVATIVFKWKWASIALFALVVAAGLAYCLFSQELYASNAQLVVRFGDSSVPELKRTPQTEITTSDRRETVLANSAILGSHDLIREVLEDVGVAAVYPTIAAKSSGDASPLESAITRFQGRLAVNVGSQDNIIDATFMHPDKAMATKLLQKLIDHYIIRQGEIFKNPQTAFMTDEVKRSEHTLAEAQAALEGFKSQWAVTNIDEEVVELLKQRSEVQGKLSQARAMLDAAQQRRDSLSKLLAGVPDTTPAAASGERYSSADDAQKRLSELQSKRSQMLATYSSNSPALEQLNAGIADAESALRARESQVRTRASINNVNTVHQAIQTDYLQASAEAASAGEPVRVYSDQLAATDRRLTDLQQIRGQYNDLNRQVQIDEDDYKSKSVRLQDARVQDMLNLQRISPAVVINAPSIPLKHARPRRAITMLACLFAGGLLALGLPFLLEAFDNRFTLPDQAVDALQLPMLAAFGRPGDMATALRRPA